MKNKAVIYPTIIFFICYAIAATFGSIFLVTWGEKSLFKSVMMFMSTFPIDWNSLMIESTLYVFLNILFWTLIFYFIAIGVSKLFSLLKQGS